MRLSQILFFSCMPILKDSPPNKLEELDDVEVIDDDFTTRRLSSAATCLVAGIEYTHGQQINRIDPCEFCLCLDGEMFCWWQDCPPASDGPCKDQGPFSQCDNIVATKTPTSKQESISNDVNSNANLNETKNKKKDSDNRDSSNSPGSRNVSSVAKSVLTSESSEEIATVTVVTSSSKFCIVMGIRYRIGDNLPHNTGNCVECICGEGAKISCSPHQCSPLGEEMNDYRPPEPRLSNVDNF